KRGRRSADPRGRKRWRRTPFSRKWCQTPFFSGGSSWHGYRVEHERAGLLAAQLGIGQIADLALDDVGGVADRRRARSGRELVAQHLERCRVAFDRDDRDSPD